MIFLILCAISAVFVGSGQCSPLPDKAPSSLIGDNVAVLCILAAFGTISLIGACALCFRRKKTFEKLENESGTAENLKKNEFPIFRALAADGINESSAIVPCERNNLSRDNLLNSSDNLASSEDRSGGGSVVDSCDVVLIEKIVTQVTSPSNREKSQPTTISYETEKDIKRLQPSSSTPLLYANNVQTYQHINDQMQQKSVAAAKLPPFKDLYADGDKNDFMVINIKEDESKDDTAGSNPFFNSAGTVTILEDQSRETCKDDISEVESSVNDNSEKYQILEEETDNEEVKLGQDWVEDVPPTLKRQDSKESNGSAGDNKSIEEALRALDIAIGSEDDGEDDEDCMNLEDVKEEATFLVDSIVSDCEKILEARQKSPKDTSDDSFEDFSTMCNQIMSTPCAQIRTKNITEGNLEAGKALFPDGIDISDVKDGTFAVDKTYEVDKTFGVDKTFEVGQNFEVDKTFEVNKTFDAPPTIKIDKEENTSEDLTTVTPVNTPIELSYSSETWDKMTCNTNTSTGAINKTVTLESASDTITFNQDGWYLHPKAKNDTFDICDYEDVEEDANAGDLSSTYDQLRRQLTEMLPHAQGMTQHNDFLDDDEDLKDSNSPSDNYGIKYGDLDEATNAVAFEMLINQESPAAPSNEMHINYKRPLSPILEESECDETCRTFVKLQDSTSTGIMDTASAEAQMGHMPKALMASNDTLFNFEDTLSDHTDNLLMSPRLHTAGSSGSSTLSRAESELTPTNEELPSVDPIDRIIRQHPLSLDLASPLPSTSKYEVTVSKLSLEDGSWPLELPQAQQIINDLSSPEQNKTGDSLSFEQDITYTIDDQKTCVSFQLKNDDERISEISEPIFASESLDLDDDKNSLQMDDIISIEADDNFNYEINDENGNQDCDTKEMEMTLNVQESASAIFDNDSINPEGDDTLRREFEADSLEPDSKVLQDDNEADSILTSQEATNRSIYSSDSIVSNDTERTVQSGGKSSDSSSQAKITEIAGDSSDESDESDKKKGSSTDIRQVSCNQGMMTTSFTKEWSDDDSSHSSEEFMYVKGGTEKGEAKSDEEGAKIEEEDEDIEKCDDQKPKNEKQKENIEMIDFQLTAGSWSKLPQQLDQIPATPIFHGDEPQMANESEDESAEEGEFVPSSWDHSLQPKRSSLKSPEKEKVAEEQPKKSRRVAFKIQRYHSVYEYPCEVVQLSPAFSEPQLWSNYMDDYSGNIDYFAYSHQLADVDRSFPPPEEGFNISSSSRPFHSGISQSHNTWPNESTDFSWSQVQEEAESRAEGSSAHTSFPSKIEWPSRRSFGLDEDDSDERPDSGVGESSDQLTDSPSMGELCHTKSTLRLPLELVSSTSSEVSDFMSDHGNTKEQEAVMIEITHDDESPKQPKSLLDNDDDESDKMILPTPSCTGSMDSLSSNSASSSSERGPPSFTTFGKENINKETDISGRTSIIFIEDDVESTQTDGDKNIHKDPNEKYILSNKLTLTVGSSDEDSGFENISRMAIK